MTHKSKITPATHLTFYSVTPYLFQNMKQLGVFPVRDYMLIVVRGAAKTLSMTTSEHDGLTVSRERRRRGRMRPPYCYVTTLSRAAITNNPLSHRSQRPHRPPVRPAYSKSTTQRKLTGIVRCMSTAVSSPFHRVPRLTRSPFGFRMTDSVAASVHTRDGTVRYLARKRATLMAGNWQTTTD